MMQPDDPPFLTVGTEVSAKYKGAFCEAKVNKVVKNVKVKITYKQGLGSSVLSDDSIKGVLKIGCQVKAFHSDRAQYLDGTVNKIQDCSQYTVVFDDGDITTLRRNSLCLKSGRHFAESETLDQLPLTHPEHFGTPVVGGRRGRRSRQNNDSGDDSSEEDNIYKKQRSEWSRDIGKVVSIEGTDKKKPKDSWFPGLVVAPTAQDTVKIETKKDYLVRSFQDGRYYTVPKKEALKFSKDSRSKVTQGGMKSAVDKALQYINHNELPTHWDREVLFGFNLSDYDSSKLSDSDTSDDETREEKDHFVAQLYKYMEECGTPINKSPYIAKMDLDLYKFFKVVQKLGGYNRIMNQNKWKVVANKMGFQSLGTQAQSLTKSAYKRYLHRFDDFYRKLGCTMVSSPKSSKVRHRSGRSLIRDCDRTPRIHKKDQDSGDSQGEEDKKETVEEPVKKVEKLVVEKEGEKPKEETPRSSRNRTPTTFASRMSPCRDKLRTPRVVAAPKPEVSKATPAPKEAVKETKEVREIKPVKKEESASEEESETGKTRSSLRNKEDQKDKEEIKKKVRKWLPRDPHQRSTSCNSNSSGTSCSSVSLQSLDPAKAPERKLKVTRGTAPVVPPPEELKKAETTIPPSEDVKKKIINLPTAEDSKRRVSNLPTPEELKKRCRKKKLPDDALNPLKKTLLPPGINVNVGDKLLVLYGPNRDEKITYEAKVLKVNENEKKPYYVHYLGWNIRYDEWVERSRVAQNLTWRQTRSKKVIKPDLNKDKKDCKLELAASPSQRTCSLKRSRSGSLVSKDDRQSERSDSSASSCHTSQRSLSAADVKRIQQKRLSRILGPREITDTDESDSDAESEQNLQLASSGSSQEEKNTESRNEQDLETNEQSPEGSNSPSSCGKDIDLKAIGAEMKGLDKPVKKEAPISLKESAGRTMNVIQGSLTFIEKKANPVKKAISVKLVPAHEVMGQIKSMTISEMKKETMMEDDIYEFKEPEPFEIGEIRSRKELKAKTQDESDSDSTKCSKAEEKCDFSPKKLSKDVKVETKESDVGIDLIEPVLKVETNKELKDYTRRVDPKDHPKPADGKKEKVKMEEADCSLSSVGNASQMYEVLNQGRQNVFSPDSTNVGWIGEQVIPFELDSDRQKLTSLESEKCKGDCYGVDIKIDPVPIKSSEPDFISPLQLEFSKKSNELMDSVTKESPKSGGLSSLGKCKLTDKSHGKNYKTGSPHVLPVQAFVSPVDSRSPVKSLKLSESSYHCSSPGKLEDRAEGKLIPFSQRQQHIFPHLLKRTEANDDKSKQKSPPSSALPQLATGSSSACEDSQQALTVGVSQSQDAAARSGEVESLPSTSQVRPPGGEVKKGHKASNSDAEKSKCEHSSIEETIEAVVHKARQDQMQADEEAKVETKLIDKRRRNPGRLKKIIAREYHADTSEESENESRYDAMPQLGRSKRLKMGDASKYSPAKRGQRLSTETEKQFSQKCHEEDKANDADEEDNENTMPIRSALAESSKRKLEGLSNENDNDKSLRSPKRRRKSMLKKEDSDETSANLLCEETFIPGSPMTQEVLTEGQSWSGAKQEMPFASVPTGSSFDKRDTQPQQPDSLSHADLSTSNTSTYKEQHDRTAETDGSSKTKDTARTSDNSSCAAGPDDNSRKRRRPSEELIDIGAYDRNMLLRAANQINDRIAVVENTPPTTPDSLLSTSSESPQREKESSKAYDTGKSGQSSEFDFDNKAGSLSEDSNTMDSSKSYSRKRCSTISPSNDLQSEDWDTEDGSSSNNQQKNAVKRPKCDESQISPRAKRKKSHVTQRFNSADLNLGLNALSLAACASGRSKYNFCRELDPELSPSKRITELETRMQECRRTYNHVKTELAVIERRRKKIRKKAREKEAREQAS